MEQHEGFFQELKQIYNIKIPIPEPLVIQQNHVQKFLFYIDLTNTQRYYEEMSKLSINNSKERIWQGGQLCQLQLNDNNKESIFCYYFNKLIQDDKQIQIHNLFRFRTFLYEFIKTQQNFWIKFVFHFILKNENQQEFEEHIIKCIYQILDGSFNKLQDIICVYNKQNKEEMNYCKISFKKIHFNKNQCYNKFDLSFIEKLDEFLDYFSYKQDVPNLIGYICQQYLQKQVNLVLKEFEKELVKLQKNISLMIEFPVNLNSEILINQNVSNYLDSLKIIITDIYIILNDDHNLFDKRAIEFQQVLNKQREKMILYLSNIVQQNSQFQIYLQSNYKGKKFEEVFNQLLQFQFELSKSDIQILQQIQKYQYNSDTIKKTVFRMTIDFKQWFEQFDLFLPQSLAYVKRIIPQQQNINLDKPYVFVLGMTKVGKSTLLNILNNPENIIITQEKKFDVKEKNKNILLSHSNVSSTFQTENLKIDNFIFVDTPGLRDTDGINRCINHVNIFNSITNAREQILLLMIDGEQLSINKNDLIDSINLINLMLGEQNDDQQLENFIIPIFTKIKQDSTMEQIIQTWQKETMKDITDQKQLKILNIIKKAIDQENYIKIYLAEHYEKHEKVQQLELEIKLLTQQISDFDLEKMDELREIQAKLKQQTQELRMVDRESLFQNKINQIKVDVLRKCENILKIKAKTLHKNSDIHQSLNFELKLNDELKQHLDKLLPHRNKFYQHLLNIITNDFIATMLFDDSISINGKVSVLYQIDKIKRNKLSDIPKELINGEIQNQINKLNHFNNIISKFDDQISDPQKVDFKEFTQKYNLINKAFTDVASIHYEGTEYLYYLWKEIDEFSKFYLILPNLVITTVVLPFIYISEMNELFLSSLFVTKIEKEKKEKLRLFQIQQTYSALIKNKSK